MKQNRRDGAPTPAARQKPPVPLFTPRDTAFFVKAIWPLIALYAAGFFVLGVFVLGYDLWTVLAALGIKAASVTVMLTVVFWTAIRFPPRST